MRRRLGLIAALTAALAMLAGCDESEPRTQVIYVATTGSVSKLKTEALAGRSVPVHAVAAPFGSDAELADKFRGLLASADRTLAFESAGGGIPEPTDTPRVLVLNDTPLGYTGISGCQGKPYTPERREERLVVRMMICDETHRLAEVQGILPRTGGDLSAGYDTLLKQGIRDILVGEDRSPK